MYIEIITNDSYMKHILHPVEDGKWWNALEEALYIHFELIPVGRYWRYELARYEPVTFTYGNTEFFTINRTSENSFEVIF